MAEPLPQGILGRLVDAGTLALVGLPGVQQLPHTLAAALPLGRPLGLGGDLLGLRDERLAGRDRLGPGRGPLSALVLPAFRDDGIQRTHP